MILEPFLLITEMKKKNMPQWYWNGFDDKIQNSVMNYRITCLRPSLLLTSRASPETTAEQEPFQKCPERGPFKAHGGEDTNLAGRHFDGLLAAGGVVGKLHKQLANLVRSAAAHDVTQRRWKLRTEPPLEPSIDHTTLARTDDDQIADGGSGTI